MQACIWIVWFTTMLTWPNNWLLTRHAEFFSMRANIWHADKMLPMLIYFGALMRATRRWWNPLREHDTHLQFQCFVLKCLMILFAINFFKKLRDIMGDKILEWLVATFIERIFLHIVDEHTNCYFQKPAHQTNCNFSCSYLRVICTRLIWYAPHSTSILTHVPSSQLQARQVDAQD
jgi:hypothetical protein